MNDAFPAGAVPVVPVSWGELLDKISILEIKAERLGEETARAGVRHELSLLNAAAAPALSHDGAVSLLSELRVVNRSLWDSEDRIREKEIAAAFDEEFIALARSIYTTNDMRSVLKRQINLLLGSQLREEKSHPRRDG